MICHLSLVMCILFCPSQISFSPSENCPFLREVHIACNASERVDLAPILKYVHPKALTNIIVNGPCCVFNAPAQFSGNICETSPEPPIPTPPPSSKGVTSPLCALILIGIICFIIVIITLWFAKDKLKALLCC